MRNARNVTNWWGLYLDWTIIWILKKYDMYDDMYNNMYEFTITRIKRSNNIKH